MATRLPSLGKSYEHVPNGIVDFIRNHCRFNDVHHLFSDIKFDDSEQRFVEKVFYGENTLVTRSQRRATGGSTLLAIIASYYALCGKNVIMLFNKKHLNDHMMRGIFRSFTINGIVMEYPTNKKIVLKHLNSNEMGAIDFLHSDNLIISIKGRSSDYIFLDAPTALSDRELYEIMAHLRPSGKMIVNKMPEYDQNYGYNYGY